MNEKKIILDFLEWYHGEYYVKPYQSATSAEVDDYLNQKEEKEPKGDEDWFMHTFWEQNTTLEA
jgi:hypothetical protein